MNPQEHLRNLALTVNEGLTAYIAVHNLIFEDAASVKSLLKNLSGSGVPMSKLLEESEALVPLWDSIVDETGEFKATELRLLSKSQKEFFSILYRYVKAVQKTVAALVNRQRLMVEGAKGAQNNPMSWKAFQEKEALYQQAVNEYMAIGEELNEARHAIFHETAETAVSLGAQCGSAFTIISRTVLDDAHWRAFGFKKCPHRGKIFEGLVPAAKLERETTLLRELWGASFGAICQWAVGEAQFIHRETFIAKLMEYAIDGVSDPIWPVFRFVTRRDAINFLKEAGADYVQTDDSDRPEVFLSRCSEHMGQPIPKVWIIGASWLFAHPNSYVFNARLALTEAGIASNYNHDIELNDEEFLTVVENIF